MTYQPITLDTMRGQLMTLDTVRERLEPTEHLAEYEFDTTGHIPVTFDYPDGWADEIGKDADGLTPTNVSISIGDITKTLTKDAALEAALKVGLQKTYTLATPGPLITQHMNYWYNNGDKELKLLAGPERGVAFVRGSVRPFSNQALIEASLESVYDRYGVGTDVLVDYKFTHNLERSDIRLIIPEMSRYIQSNVREEPDQWSVGLNIHNSLTGMTPLEISAYSFSWVCTNGMISEHISSGKYRRKPTVATSDAYEWARDSVDAVLGGMEQELEKIAHLPEVSLENELVDTLESMFKEFGVPTTMREFAVNNLAESEDLSAYGLMAAVTSVGNLPGLSDKHVDAILRAGGRIPDALAHRCPTCHKV